MRVYRSSQQSSLDLPPRNAGGPPSAMRYNQEFLLLGSTEVRSPVSRTRGYSADAYPSLSLFAVPISWPSFLDWVRFFPVQLSDLRDKIKCVADLTTVPDVRGGGEGAPDPADPAAPPVGPPAKEVYRSGFFYIEGTFYNDTRSQRLLNLMCQKHIQFWAIKG